MITLLDSNNRKLTVQNMLCKILIKSRKKTNLLWNKNLMLCSFYGRNFRLIGWTWEQPYSIKVCSDFWDTLYFKKPSADSCCGLNAASLSIAALFSPRSTAWSPYLQQLHATGLLAFFCSLFFFFTSNGLMARFNSDNFFCLSSSSCCTRFSSSASLSKRCR